MKKLITILSLVLLSHSVMADEADTLLTDQHPINEPIEVVSPDSLWDRANTAYINENYNSALDIYNSIIERGLKSDKLYYNMGNAYYKKGEIAKAILYYQKAHKLSPADVDIAHNLKVAQAQTKDRIEQMPEFFLKGWSRSIESTLGCTGWTLVSIMALVVALASILIFLLSSKMKLRKCGFAIGIISIIVGGIATMYASSQRRHMVEQNSAVVMSRSVSIKSSPDHSATDLFVLHEGTTVKIEESLGEWHNITIADGKKGWIEAKRIEII